MLQCIQHFPSILEPVEETWEKRPRRGNSETYLGMVMYIPALKRSAVQAYTRSLSNKIKCIITYLLIFARSPSPCYITKEELCPLPEKLSCLCSCTLNFQMYLIWTAAGMSYQMWSVVSSTGTWASVQVRLCGH